MTRAEQSYSEWWADLNGMPATAHSFGKIPYVTGYGAGYDEGHSAGHKEGYEDGCAIADDLLRSRLIAAVKSSMDREPSMAKVIDLIREI